MATVSGNIVILDSRDQEAARLQAAMRMALHNNDRTEHQLTGALGEVAVVAWATHHRVFQATRESACNIVIRNRGVLKNTIRVGVRTTQEVRGAWSRVLWIPRAEVGRLLRAGARTVFACSISDMTATTTVTIRGALPLPAFGKEVDADVGDLFDVTQFIAH